MMSKSIALILGLVLVCSILLVGVTSVQAKKSTEEKNIVKALKSVGYKNVCKLSITTKTDNHTKTIYDNPKCVIVIPPPVITCPPDQHLVNGVCVPNIIPPPPPVGTTSKVCLVGDLSGSSVPNKMVNCNLKIGLGDLGYASDLKYFKALNFDKCVIGNHDAPEDGSDAIYKEALAYCGDSWFLKVGKGALLMGFNTNGNLDVQLGAAQKVVKDPAVMTGIKSLYILSHKPCYTSPNSHHPVESKVKTLCDSLISQVPAGVKVYYIAGHNHQMASTADGMKFLSGAGGRSHYSCGTDAQWTFCDNSNYGYLELTVDNDSGATTTKFVK